MNCVHTYITSLIGVRAYVRYASKRRQQTWHHVRHFSPTVRAALRWSHRTSMVAPHFDGRTAVQRLSPTVHAALRWSHRSATSFSHRARRTSMVAPQCNVFLPLCAPPHFDGRTAVQRLVKRRNPCCRENVVKIAARLAKSAAIPYPGASRTNPEANHKSVARFLIKKWRTNFTNCCVLFDAHPYGICNTRWLLSKHFHWCCQQHTSVMCTTIRLPEHLRIA